MSAAPDPTAAPPSPDGGDRLASRYGETRARRIRGRVAVWSIGVFAVIVAVVWVFWAGPLQPGSSVEGKDVAHTITGEHGVDVTFQLTADPGTEVRCAIQALDEQFTIIGWKVVDIPASDSAIRTFTESLVTVETPNTGLIYSCWEA